MPLNNGFYQIRAQVVPQSTQTDKNKNISVVEELNLRTFEVRYRNNGTTPVFIRDTADILHIHSTMLVAVKKYPNFFPLGEFVEK